MMLPSLQLDDLKWRAMVDAIRSRIAGVSDEQWTLHAPVDPGVTLLELYAHLLEQRAYWLDQVSDPLLTALIALLGAEPLSAQAATMMLEITSANAVLARGTVFERREREFPVRFVTDEDVATLPIERIDVTSAFGTTRSAASSQPRWAMQSLTLLPADRAAGNVELTLWSRALPTKEQWGKHLALLVELQTPARIPGSWSTEAVADVPTPAQLTWSYGVAGASSSQPFAPDATVDGTQGLRRSGVVRIAIPEEWSAAQAPLGQLQPLRLQLRTERSSFSSPPRLRRIVPNVVAAAHAVPVSMSWEQMEAQVRHWLPLPGLKLQLAERSPPLEDSVSLRLLGRDGEWREWRPTRDFARHGPADAVFTVDRIANCLRFGDGLTGRLPVLRTGPGPRAELHYLAGGGDVGSVGSNLSWIAMHPAVAEAINPVPARGGRETETAAEARDRVSASLYEPFRAVTAADYEKLAMSSHGIAVARARAATGVHPAFPCVNVPGSITVFIVPEVPRHEGWQNADYSVKTPLPDPGMLTLVSRLFEERRLLTTEVFVRAPVYRAVEVAVTLAGQPLNPAELTQRLREGLTTYFDALSGGSERTGWPFGQPVRPSEVAHVLQQLVGDEAQLTQLGVRLYDEKNLAAPFESCVDVAIGAHELIVLRALNLTLQPSLTSSGGLR
jgi:predicted phage baseplate assembly protein